jgi:hypothetical protein
MAWVRERTIPIEQPALVGEVSADFCGLRVPRSQRDGNNKNNKYSEDNSSKNNAKYSITYTITFVQGLVGKPGCF